MPYYQPHRFQTLQHSGLLHHHACGIPELQVSLTASFGNHRYYKLTTSADVVELASVDSADSALVVVVAATALEVFSIDDEVMEAVGLAAVLEEALVALSWL